MRLFLQISYVAFGSALGGLARWAVTIGAARLFGMSFPWGTLIINLSGSLFLGWFATMLSQKLPTVGCLRADDLKLMIAVGFTGAYTTFSTFEMETDSMIRGGDGLGAAIYVAGSVFLGLLAVRLGVRLAQMM